MNQILKKLNLHHIMFRFADKVAIGDELLAQGYDNLTPAKVVNVSTFKLQGDYLSDYKYVFKNISWEI